MTTVLESLPRVLYNIRYATPFFTQRIGYIGWIGHENLGDEAIYHAFKSLFTQYSILPFKFSQKIASYESIIQRPLYDATCLGGGTLLFADGTLNLFESAVQRYAKSFVFASGARNPEFWRGHKDDCQQTSRWVECLNRCTYVGVRGPISQKILAEYGCKGEILGDLALSLFDGSPFIPKKNQKRIGINIGNTNGKLWGSDEPLFISKITRILQILVERKWNIEFFPVTSGDIPIMQQIMKNAGVDIPVFPHYKSVSSSLAFMKSCDVFMGEKLHSVVLAVVSGTPSLMLEYRPKCRDFMQSMGLEDYTMRVDQISCDAVLSMLQLITDNSSHIQRRLLSKVTTYRKLQLQAARKIQMACSENL